MKQYKVSFQNRILAEWDFSLLKYSELLKLFLKELLCDLLTGQAVLQHRLSNECYSGRRPSAWSKVTENSQPCSPDSSSLALKKTRRESTQDRAFCSVSSPQGQQVCSAANTGSTICFKSWSEWRISGCQLFLWGNCFPPVNLRKSGLDETRWARKGESP